MAETEEALKEFKLKPPPTSVSLRDLISASSISTAAEFNKCGQLYPPRLIYFYKDQDGADAANVIARETDDKSLFAILARAILELHHATRYLQIEEAWTLEPEAVARLGLERIDREGIAGNPDRKEIIAYMGEDLHEGTVNARQWITRDPKGRPRVGGIEFLESTGRLEVVGRFAGLLPRPKGRAN